MFSDSNLYCNFIKASTTNSGETWKDGQSINNKHRGTLTGFEAKEFYENLISSKNHSKQNDNNDLTENLHDGDRETNRCRKITKKDYSAKEEKLTLKILDYKTERKSPTKNSTDRTASMNKRRENTFLQHAQNGDLNELKKLLRNNNIDINAIDQYGWTAVMCASFSGNTEVVRFLLDKGALWKDVVNSNGQTALDLAKLAKQHDVCRLFESWLSVSSRNKRKRANKAQTSVLWCSVCEMEFTDDVKKHQSSTVHQFNCQHKPKETYYGIADDNPGYKLMVKSGWNEEKGLGPEGEGRKYPIKTVLKRDRHGLGSREGPSTKPRVTHFGPHDDTAVKRQKYSNNNRKQSQRTLTKKQKRIKESKDRAWEKNMRLYMNT